MEKKDRKEIRKAVSVLLMFVLLAVAGQIMTSCCRKVYPVEIRERHDTVVELRIIRDSVAFEVPVYKEINVTRDSSSHLENPYAASDASIEGGILHHSLETRPQKIYVPYEVSVTDTLVVHEKADTIVREVEKNLTKWQAFSMVLGRLLGGLLMISLLLFALFKHLKK